VNNWISKTPPEVVAATTGIRDETGKQNFINEFSRTVGAPWFRYFFRYNPDQYVRKIKAKVLALNGDKDVQVISSPNLAALRHSLQNSGAKTFDIVEFKGLNHLFQHCTRCTVDEYGALEETIAPEVLETIGNWLKKNIEQENKGARK
jgi:dipeptidyl aminopeptidase/acylaminoacyl peptidase